jgi:hypothetical protein
MTYQELMMQSLSELLEDDEILKYPLYGVLQQKNKRWFSFWGLTDKYLLGALLYGGSKKITWTIRVPLEIKSVQVKKSIVPFQYKIHIEFQEGSPFNMRVSKKVVGFKQQEINLSNFIRCIQENVAF